MDLLSSSVSSEPYTSHMKSGAWIPTTTVIFCWKKHLPPNPQTSLNLFQSSSLRFFMLEKMNHCSLNSECHSFFILASLETIVWLPDPLLCVFNASFSLLI